MGQAPRLELWPYPQMGSGYVDLHLTTGQSSREFHEIIPPPPVPADDGEASAGRWQPGSPAHGRNLRIALTMKGGVSLAVWIGGAVAELDVLRRIRIYRGDQEEDRALLIFPRPHLAVGNRPSPEPARSGDWGAYELEFQRADIYARALHRLRYDRVDIDILAGASAGGLNAVLYGVAQRAGVSVSSLLDTWMTAASAWDLLQVNHPTRSPDAVFQGDDYFWPQVYEALKTIASDRASETHAVKAEHLVIDLAATLIDSRDTVETNASSGRADFRFVAMPDDDVEGRSIPAPLPATEDAADGDDAVERAAQRTEFEQDLARLAYAARATSSFPGAFEPALIYSSTNRFDTTPSAGPPNMRTTFNAHRPDGFNRPFRVVDGGVFDNIPIARTLRAILNNPAETYSDTAILYLDPSPKEETTWLVRPTEYSGPPPVLPPDRGTNRNDPPSRFIPSLIATLNKRRIGETGASETERVDDMRIAALFSDGRARPFAFDVFADDATWQRAYANYRAAADAQLLIPVFRRPGEWALGTNLPERPLRTARGRESLVLLEQELGDLLRGPATPDAAIREGAQGLVDATRCALAWLRSIEDTMFHVTPPGGSTQPPLGDESAISIGDYHEDFRALRRRISTTLRAVVDERDRRIARLLAFAETNVSDPAKTWTREQAGQVAVEWVGLDAEGWIAAETHWDTLAEIIPALTWYSFLMRQSERWQSQPWYVLGVVGPSLSPKSLPLLFPVSGVASRNEPIRFHRIGSDAQPAAPERFTLLMHGQLLNAYRAGLAKPPRDLTLTTVSNLFDESRLRSTSKLAGSTLSNFAGFLSSDWRVNDWWWGRMDAAAGILSFLETTPHVDDEPALSGQLRPLQDALLQEMNAEIETRRPFPKRLAPKPPRTMADPDEIRRRMDRGAQNLSALHSGYLVALASRAARTLSSTMARAQVWVSPKRFLHWLLRPILVLVPTALDPPRLTIIAILVACGALLAWPSRPFDLANFDLGNRTPAEIIPRVVVFAAIVAIPITRFIAAGIANRRARHRILIHTSGQALSRQVIAEADRRARGSRWILVTLSMLLAVATATAGVVLGFVGAVFWVGLIGTLVVTEVATRYLQTAPLARVGRAKWWLLVVVAGIASLGAAIWLSMATVASADGRSPWFADELEAPLALPLAAGYASIAFAIGISLFIGTMRVRSMLGISLAGAVVAGAVCIAFLAFARDAWFYDYTPIGEQSAFMRLALISTANVLLVAWTTGTLYWLVPWRRRAVESYGARRADGRSRMDRVIER